MRKGSIKLQNLSGGEVTSSPILETPSKYSRLLRNFYINSEGHICKVPGYSAVSQEVSGCELNTGIDFKKSDGTSIILAGGRYNTGSPSLSSAFTASTTVPAAVFTGVGLNDMTSGGTYTGAADAVVIIEVYGIGDPNGIRWNKNGGAWTYAFIPDMPDGTPLVLSDGVTVAWASHVDHTAGDYWTITIVYPGLDDLIPSGTFSGTGASTFEVVIDTVAATDKFKWRKDGGAYTTGVSITGAAQLLSDGVSVTFGAITGHGYGAKWTITASSYKGSVFRLDNSILSAIKSDFTSEDPIYMSQMGDLVVMANYSDRPVAYDGSTFQNINLPFGNSVEFVGTGLNDFSANISFTYDTATYEVIVDAVGTPSITPVFAGAGIDDMAVPNPNFSGDAQSANFDLKIDSTGGGDTFKYNLNGGLFIEDNALSTLAPGTLMAGTLRLKASATVGHNSEDFYEVLVSSNGSPDKYQWRKNGGAWSAEANVPVYPAYAALDSDYSISFVTGTSNATGTVYGWQVDGATNPDTFQWQKDGGAWSASIDIVPGAIDIGEGISVQFDYMTGHTLNDAWDFDAERDTVKYRETSGAYTTGVLITGEYQDIVAGVQFKFSAINGHTLGDKWTIPIEQNTRIGKTYPYKNRLWAIGADRLTAYHSDLAQPTNFTGDGAGYIDFRFVLPEGDELLDICSVLNYLAFFFKNHIVVYSGTDPTAEGDFVVYQTIANLGIVAPEVVVPVGSDVFFLTDKGVKNLKQVLNAGAVNVDNVSAAIDQDVVDAIKNNTSGVYDSAHYPKYGLVMFLIGATMFVFNYRNNSWSRIVIPTTDDAAKILGMFNDSDGGIYMGGYDYLFKFDPATATYNFNGQAPTYIWKTGMLPATNADALYFTEMVLRLASFKAATLTVKARAVGFDTGYEDQSAFNEQSISVSAATPSDVVMNFVRAPLWGAGKYIQLEITEAPTNVSNDDLEITGLEIQGEVGSV